MTDQIQDFELKYDNNVLVLHIVINTNQDARKLAKNIQRIAKGPRLDALVCWVEQYSGDNGRKVWEEIQRLAVKAAANPNSKPYSLDEDPK